MVAEEEADVDAEESCWGVVIGTVPWLSERGISSWRLRFVVCSATIETSRKHRIIFTGNFNQNESSGS